MKIEILTLDIGNVYQELDKQFCVSPRSKEKLYTYCIVGKPMRLLVVADLEQISDDMLRSIIEYMNEKLLHIDGFFCHGTDPIIWMMDPSSIIYCKRVISFEHQVSDYSDYITAHSYIPIEHVQLPEEWTHILCQS